jgi:3-(3-hydroxy-phenyl)propionate hydroxylase
MYFEYVEQPFAAPAESAGEELRHPIIIVGAGPVGLCLAVALARYGIRSVVLEKRGTIAYGSRAICISQRSLDIVEKIGVSAPFIAKGYPWSSGTTRYRDRIVLEFEMPQPEGSAHPPMINLQQCYTEQYLYEAARASGPIDIRWHSTLTTVRQRDGFVELTVDTPEGSYRTEATYLVACDGARSAVRRELGLGLQGTSYEGRYVIADVTMRGKRRGRQVWFDPPSNPGSTVIMHCQPDDLVRIDYQLLEGQDAEAEVEETRVLDKVKSHLDWIGERRAWSLEGFSLYKAHSRTLDRYVHGHVLFAGDAAHLVPIFGVRGLNSGLEDACNLAWKLAYVLTSRSPYSLLETYCEERVAAARENMRQAEKSAGFMTPTGKGPRLMRDAVLSLALSHGFVRELINPRQARPVRYDLLGARKPHGTLSGQPCPNLLMELHDRAEKRSASLYSLLGNDFALLVFNAADRRMHIEHLRPLKVLHVAGSLVEGSVPVIFDPHRRLQSILKIEETGAVLVRPDGYVVDVFAMDELDEVRRYLTDFCPQSAQAAA